MTKETVMNRMSLEPQITLYRSTILPTLLYGCEMWTLGKKQEENMEQIQLKCLRNILHAEKVIRYLQCTIYGNGYYAFIISNGY